MGGGGMKGVDTIARIRREFFVRGRMIKEIVRGFFLGFHQGARKIHRPQGFDISPTGTEPFRLTRNRLSDKYGAQSL